MTSVHIILPLSPVQIYAFHILILVVAVQEHTAFVSIHQQRAL